MALIQNDAAPMALIQNDGNPYLVKPLSAVATTRREAEAIKHRSSSSIGKNGGDYVDEKPIDDPEINAPSEDEEEESRRSQFYRKFRPYILTGVGLVIFGWWVSATILKATRHRWCVIENVYFDR